MDSDHWNSINGKIAQLTDELRDVPPERRDDLEKKLADSRREREDFQSELFRKNPQLRDKQVRFADYEFARNASRSSRTRSGSSSSGMFAMSCTPSSEPSGSASSDANNASKSSGAGPVTATSSKVLRSA